MSKSKLSELLGEVKPYASFCFILFLVGIFFGIMFYPPIKPQLEQIINQVFSGVLVENDDLQTILNVFLRNVMATIIMVFTGLLIIPVLLIIFMNGFLVGLVGRFAIDNGLTVTKLILSLIPHGIFEIPALIISAGFGLKIGLSIFQTKTGTLVYRVSKNIKKAAFVYIVLIIPLLLIAAFMEILVSKNLVM